ncbi:MAG: hypothetical protein H0W07_07545 [Chloroflexi bacterium]|nr:hypothetical protein [Chloroflexota bacterium]
MPEPAGSAGHLADTTGSARLFAAIEASPRLRAAATVVLAFVVLAVVLLVLRMFTRVLG